MKIHRQSYTVTTADYTVDLRTLAADAEAGDVQRLADFDIEVVGNDAVVTLTAKGSFPTSEFLPVTDGTFTIGGRKVSCIGFTLAELQFSRTGTTEYTINITRQIRV